jgi:ParB-like chromosome segregation protein Spo0J
VTTTELPAVAARAEQFSRLEQLGTRLSGLRLCLPTAVRALRESLEQRGQLSALLVIEAGEQLEVLDGFKRLAAARELGWPELRVLRQPLPEADAKAWLVALHAVHGLTELEEGWLVRSLHRDHGLPQSAVAAELGRHKSWVCRRLLLVESLDAEVQARVRLGLLAPRAALALHALPRGNQAAAGEVVARRGLTVRQTELFVTHLLEQIDTPARQRVLDAWHSGLKGPVKPAPRPSRALRSEADWMATDVTTLHRVAARLQARLLGTPLMALGAAAAELLDESLQALLPVLERLSQTIATATATHPQQALPHRERAP